MAKNTSITYKYNTDMPHLIFYETYVLVKPLLPKDTAVDGPHEVCLTNQADWSRAL